MLLPHVLVYMQASVLYQQPAHHSFDRIFLVKCVADKLIHKSFLWLLICFDMHCKCKTQIRPNWRPDDDVCRGSAKLQQVRDDDEFFELWLPCLHWLITFKGHLRHKYDRFYWGLSFSKWGENNYCLNLVGQIYATKWQMYTVNQIVLLKDR